MQGINRTLILLLCMLVVSINSHAYTRDDCCDPCCVEEPSYIPITEVRRGTMRDAAIPYSRDCCPEKERFNIILGADVKLANLNSKWPWNQIFPQTYTGGSIYIGTRFYKYYGLEVGYDFLPRTTRNVSLLRSGTFFNVPVPSDFGVTTQISVREWRADFNLYWPVQDDESFTLLAALGVGYFKTILNGNLRPNNNTIFNTVITGTKINPLYVWRFGLGFQSMLTNTLGIRALVRWEGTSKLTITGNANFNGLLTASGVTNNPFKNVVVVNVGFFTMF